MGQLFLNCRVKAYLFYIMDFNESKLIILGCAVLPADRGRKNVRRTFKKRTPDSQKTYEKTYAQISNNSSNKASLCHL